MRNLRSLLKKAHLFRCTRTTRSNVLPEYACARGFVARLASGTFLIRLQERVFRQSLGEMLVVWCLAVMLSGCAAAVATDGEIASTENLETSVASCPYLRTQQASCGRTEKSLR